MGLHGLLTGIALPFYFYSTVHTLDLAVTLIGPRPDLLSQKLRSVALSQKPAAAFQFYKLDRFYAH
jgi:hypothetical protein